MSPDNATLLVTNLTRLSAADVEHMVLEATSPKGWASKQLGEADQYSMVVVATTGQGVRRTPGESGYADIQVTFR